MDLRRPHRIHNQLYHPISNPMYDSATDGPKSKIKDDLISSPTATLVQWNSLTWVVLKNIIIYLSLWRFEPSYKLFSGHIQDMQLSSIRRVLITIANLASATGGRMEPSLLLQTGCVKGIRSIFGATTRS